MNSSGWSFWSRMFRFQDGLLLDFVVEFFFILMYGLAFDFSISSVIILERYPASSSSNSMVVSYRLQVLRSAFTSCTPNLWSCFQPLELRPTRILLLSLSTARWTLTNFRFTLRFPFLTRIHCPYWFKDSPVASMITVNSPSPKQEIDSCNSAARYVRGMSLMWSWAVLASGTVFISHDCSSQIHARKLSVSKYERQNSSLIMMKITMSSGRAGGRPTVPEGLTSYGSPFMSRRCFICWIHWAYFHFLCPLYCVQYPFLYRLYLRPLYLLFFLFFFLVFASHPLLLLNGMRCSTETFLKSLYNHLAGETLIPFLFVAKTIWALPIKLNLRATLINENKTTIVWIKGKPAKLLL